MSTEQMIADRAEGIEQRISSLIEEFNGAQVDLYDEHKSPEEQIEAQRTLEKVFDTVSKRTDELVVNSHLEGLELGVHLEIANRLFAKLPISSNRVSEYQYSFETYATAKSAGRSKSQRDNLMRAARVFIIGGRELDIPKGVTFNAWLVPPSNLIAAAHRAETGTLSEKAWAMLSSPKTKQRDLIQQMHVDSGSEEKLPMSDERVLYIENGVLYFVDTVAGETVGLASIEDDEDPSVQRGISLLGAVIKSATADKVSKLIKENAV